MHNNHEENTARLPLLSVSYKRQSTTIKATDELNNHILILRLQPLALQVHVSVCLRHACLDAKLERRRRLPQ